MKMTIKYMRQAITVIGYCLLVAGFSACSSDDDPYFTAGEDDAPRILNTNIPEGKKGEMPVLMTIDRTQNFQFEVIVTPVRYTTVTWYIDDVEKAQGLAANFPVLAGDHVLKIVATTTKGLSTSRTLKLVVNPLAGDPELASDGKSRWLTIGTTKTINCNHVNSVAKVLVGQQEATNVSYADGKLTFDVPTMEKGEYSITIVDANGDEYGCGRFTVSDEDYSDLGIKETVVWTGDVDINWGASNVLITPDQLADVSVGATIQLYYELVDMPENYHAMRITTSNWGDAPEDQVVAQFDLTGETQNPFEFTYSAANKEIVDSRGGMLIVGYGYKLTKVVVIEGVAPAETTLWTGDVDINWGASNVLITPDEMADVTVGSTIHLYYEMVDMPDNYHAMRITTSNWGDDPGDQVVAQFDLTGDTANPYEFTYSAANKEIVDSRGGMLIVGYGYKLTKVTFTK